ncbi:hypothetical protein ASF12_20420 [Paenibacillus sp. Leaf72]|nr:hypothetical protein ASF12_20420 [Paenibacillus sp. Leaf72]
MTQVVITNMTKTIFFKRSSEVLCDIAGFNSLSQLIQIDILLVISAVGFTTYGFIESLKLTNTQQ